MCGEKTQYLKPSSGVTMPAVRILALLALVVTLVVSGRAKGQSNAAVGAGAFRIYCANCHGMKAQGGRSGPDLSQLTAEDEVISLTISAGVSGTEMPAFGENLTPETIRMIVAFLRSAARPNDEKAAGDSSNGEKVFWGKGGCGQCHAVGSRGGRIGPDLSRIGRQRSPAHLKQSILDPDEDPPRGYETVTLVKRDGTRISGVEKGFDNFGVRLVDSAQRFYSFDLAELASVERNSHSLMPGDYGKRLTPAEIDDLTAYLSTLRTQEVKP